MIKCWSAACLRAGPRSRSTIAAAFRAARTCSGRSTAPRAICSSPPPAASPKIWELDVHGGKGAQSSLENLPVPERYRWAPPQVPGRSTNVAQAYARFARDYREEMHFCPTFEDAVTRHRMLDAIE